MSTLTPAEQKIRKLARMPANCACPNCGTYKKLGFSTVCIKFHTFVCNNCKSSHQAISHRCKSLTMSSWSDQEASELMQKGNEYARNTWLCNAPPVGSNGRPKEGDPIDVFKRFVVDAYERKKYYGEGGAPAPAKSAAPPPSMPQRASVTAPPPPRRPAPAKVAAPTADLLDFSAAPATQAAPSAPFAANFDAFTVSPAPAPPVATAASSSSFGFLNPPPAAPTPTAAPASSSGFGFISSPPAPAPAPAGGFADFASFSSPAPAPLPVPAEPASKKPVMGNSAMNNRASAISAMDNLSAGQQQQQRSINIDPFGQGGASRPSANMQPMTYGNPQQQMSMQQNFGMPTPQQQQQFMMMQQMQMQRQQQQMNGMMMMGGANNNVMGGSGMNPNMSAMSSTWMNSGAGTSNANDPFAGMANMNPRQN